jgi:hypothetical protein
MNTDGTEVSQPTFDLERQVVMGSGFSQVASPGMTDDSQPRFSTADSSGLVLSVWKTTQ